MRKNIQGTNGFKMTEAELNNIHNISSRFYSTIDRKFTFEIQVDSYNNSTRNYSSIADLVEADNVSGHKIATINIVYRSVYEHEKHDSATIRIRFRDAKTLTFFPAIDIDIQASAQEHTQALEMAHQELSRVCRRVSFSRVSSYLLHPITYVPIYFLLYFAGQVIKITTREINDPLAEIREKHTAGTLTDPIEAFLLYQDAIHAPQVVSPWVNYLDLSAILVFIFGLFTFIVNYFFPRHAYYWSDYMYEYKRRHSIGYVLFILIALGFVISFLGSYFANMTSDG